MQIRTDNTNLHTWWKRRRATEGSPRTAERGAERAPEGVLARADAVEQHQQEPLGVRPALLRGEVGPERVAAEDRAVVRERPDAAAVVAPDERVAVHAVVGADRRAPTMPPTAAYAASRAAL